MEITLPKIKVKSKNEERGVFIISPLFPGYGMTVGNSLRRVLLSSLAGAAIVEVKIEGATHEFSTIEGVKEDMIDFVLALKKVRLRLHDEEAVLKLEKKNEGTVKAGEIKTPASVEIINKDLVLLNLSAGGKISATMKARKGIGYVPAEEIEKEESLGVIALDATFTPVRKVNFKTEFTRVGKKTNYDKLTLEIETDGTVDPEEALKQAAKILKSHFSLVERFEEKKGKIEAEVKEKVKTKPSIQTEKKRPSKTPKRIEKKGKDKAKLTIEQAGFSSRTERVLQDGGVRTIAGLRRLSDEKLSAIKGLGKKGIAEIDRKLKRWNLR